MPAQAGIHDLTCCDKGKLWIPACAGMTWAQGRRVNLSANWNDADRNHAELTCGVQTELRGLNLVDCPLHRFERRIDHVIVVLGGQEPRAAFQGTYAVA